MPWPSWAFSRTPSKDQNESPSAQQTASDLAKAATTKAEEAKAAIHEATTPITTSLPSAPNTWTTSPLNTRDTAHYTSTQTLIFATLTSAATLALYTLYKSHLRRIPGADYLKPSFFRRRSLYGHVTSVGDGDNFRLFHTPGGRMLGWGWARKIGSQQEREWNKAQSQASGNGNGGTGRKRMGATHGTVHVRIAGVDAPEAAHFGRPAQPFSAEALAWLKGEILERSVRVYPYRRDQYDRVVCSVYRRRWFGLWRQDVGLAMLRRGFATVYEAKFGSEFAGKEEVYREAEARAKAKGVGMWERPGVVDRFLGRKGKGEKLESPRDYKTRMAQMESKDEGSVGVGAKKKG